MMRHALLALALIGCKAELPALSDGNGALDATCSGPFADTVVDTFPTAIDGKVLLGAPDGLVVMLMVDQVATVGFIGLGAVTDQQGMDLRVHAMAPAGGGHAIVHVAGPDMQFRFAGDVMAGTTDVDIAVATVPAAVYARVIGVDGTVQVDAFEAIHDTCP